MRQIIGYDDFINEEFFNFFRRSSKKKSMKIDKIEECVCKILEFLKDNQIEDWNDYMSMTAFDRDIVHKLIDSSVDNMSELEEVRFRIRLELSDRKQLIDYKIELEEMEEYEKCAIVAKKISQI